MSEALKAYPLNRDGKFKTWVATIGNFDGLHVGHLELLNDMRNKARELNAGIALITFNPHPREILFPNKEIPKIYDWNSKLKLCEQYGVDTVYQINFDKSMAEMEAEDFVNYLFHQLNVAQLYVGYDFCFGKNRSGNFNLLKKLSNKKNIKVNRIKLVEINGNVVSSSEIRTCLAKGDFDVATNMLGRNWSFRSIVQEGNKMGAKLGFPTFNIYPTSKMPISNGVYASVAVIDKISYNAVTNLGLRPTIHENSKVVAETHILNYSGDLYDQEVEVVPIQFLRSEIKFQNIEFLKQQIAEDIQQAEQIFSLL